MTHTYHTQGICARRIAVELDGNIIKKVDFDGGCNGNTKGISALVEGMSVEEIEEKFEGITCGFKSTSCPDQLAKAVRLAFDEENSAETEKEQRK